MADTSRKRSRKSKLVPRECDAYFYDESGDLEEKLQNGFSRKALDIKNEPTTSTSTCLITEMYTGETFTDNTPMIHVSEPPMQINVKVEVERCNDTNISSQKTMEIDQAAFWRKYKAKKFNLSNGIIVATADKIKKYSTDIADKILDVAVRNTTGHIVKGALQSCSDLSKGIQNALDNWKDWQTKHFLRDGPLFYKCYICNNAWWYLEDFKQHLKKHSSLNIAAEGQSQHEVNIIAYFEPFPTKTDIFVHGKCGRCGKDYENHCTKSYICHGCLKQFHTCLSLGFHVSNCQNLGAAKTRITCNICRLEIPSIQNYDHLVTVHSVRSDVPIITRRCQYSTCEDCYERYINKNSHVCSNSTYTKCKHCFRGFPTKFLADLHLEGYAGQFQCPICNEQISHECMKYEHMLKHSDKYAVVIKCVLCTKFAVFLSNTGFLKHMKIVHRNVDSTKPGHFTQIMVPKSCLHPNFDPFPTEPNIYNLDYYTEGTTEDKQENVPIKTEPEVESDKGELIMDEEIQEIPSIQIKTEPLDTEQHSDVIIKEEPLYIEENIETPDYSFSHDIIVKQELDNDIDVYEEDIIRLDMNFDIKEEKNESQDTESMEFEEESMEFEEDSSEEDFSDYDEESSQIANKKLYKCTKCGFTDIHKNYKIHITNDCHKSCFSTKKFPCSQCGDSFKTLGKYLTHLTLHGFEALKCPQCFNVYVSQARFVSHVMSHVKQYFVKIKAFNGDGPNHTAEYQCSKCSTLVESEEFFSHWETHVSKGEPLEMSLSKVNVETPTVLELLARLHKRTKQCCYCHRTFTRFNECKRHQIEHLLTDAYDHKDQYRELRCQICAVGFSTPEKYRQHMRDHASLPVYRCEMCDKSFSDSSNFTKHKKVHNFKVFVCDLCRKKFQSKSGLEKHIQMHMTTKPIVCDLCMKSFFFESTYRKHVKYQHNKESVGYPCVICNIRFNALQHKWKHMWEIHQERKSNADCPICQKSFRILSEVKSHMKREHNTHYRRELRLFNPLTCRGNGQRYRNKNTWIWLNEFILTKCEKKNFNIFKKNMVSKIWTAAT